MKRREFITLVVFADNLLSEANIVASTVMT
jgi:hypothetical protein